jgi:hypothetical protein
MNPSSVPHPARKVSKAKLAFWGVVLVVGGFLGYEIAYGIGLHDSYGFGWIAVVFLVGTAVAILALFAVIGGIAALVPDRGGRPTMRVVTVAAVTLVVGLGIGGAIDALVRLGHHDPVKFAGAGTLSVTLDRLDGFAGRGDVAAHCSSGWDSTLVARIEADSVGRVRAGTVDATVILLPEGSSDGRPVVYVSVRPADTNKNAAPTWYGAGDVVERIDGDRRGRIAFTGATLTSGDESMPRPEGWPVSLSGSVSWSCDPMSSAGASSLP